MRQSSRALHLPNDRIKRAVGVLRRAEIAQARVRLGVKPLFQCKGYARLADSRFARDQHDLSVACLGTLPAAQQQVDLFVAADERAQRRSVQSREPALHRAFLKHLPTPYRFAIGAHDRIELAAFEQITEQVPGRALDHHGVRFCRNLKA